MLQPDLQPNSPVHPPGQLIENVFFERDAQQVAQDMLGLVLCHRIDGQWLAAQIIECEAYKKNDKASHASLGYTEKRKALFMPPGTIYMYFARGGDSFNISCGDEGDAVLVKSAIPWPQAPNHKQMVHQMSTNNPLPGGRKRPMEKLCAGQTLLCNALALRVRIWDQATFNPNKLILLDTGIRPSKIVQTTRLGIPAGRDEHLLYRFVDFDHVRFATRNPIPNRKTGKTLPYKVFTNPK